MFGDMDDIRHASFGPVTVCFGDKTGKYPDGNQVLVAGSDTLCAFDTPLVSNRIGPAFDAADLVVLGHVHEDHMAGLHRLPHAPVHVHELDLDAARSWDGLVAHYGASPAVVPRLKAKLERDFFYAPRPDALGYADGACWELGGGVRVTAVHMPGHTAGHCVLLVEPDGVAFIGDIDLTGFGPYYGDATSSLADFRRTLARLPSVPARTWVTSHHRGVYVDRGQFLDALAAFASRIDEREQRLLRMLRERPRSVQELVACRLLYPPGYDEVWVEDAERRSIVQHLDELAGQARVTLREDGRYAPA
jgi:glyoxylase-like metal-dependent hydrolase (beta-lactamase superfamily II)